MGRMAAAESTRAGRDARAARRRRFAVVGILVAVAAVVVWWTRREDQTVRQVASAESVPQMPIDSEAEPAGTALPNWFAAPTGTRLLAVMPQEFPTPTELPPGDRVWVATLVVTG